MTKVKDRRYW